jgi:hypothetical protein
LLVDDPIRSRDEAWSPTVRENVWEWFHSSARTRLRPIVDIPGFGHVSFPAEMSDDAIAEKAPLAGADRFFELSARF